MIAVRISSDIPMAIGGSPEYFRQHPRPDEPRALSDHRCINLRLPTLGGSYGWKLSKNGRPVHVHLEGQLIFNSIDPILETCIAGLGLACLPLDHVEAQLADHRLIRVLDDWTDDLPGYHLNYPSRRHHSLAFKLLVEKLRHRPRASRRR
jgi:DNA-binding transcriptional LysR family regulator